MGKYFKIIFLIILIQRCFGQEQFADSLFYRFKNNIEIEQRENSGTVVSDNETMLSYYLFLNNCSIESLLNYTNDSNPAIRCMIFSGLIGKGADKKILQKVYHDHINDSATYSYKPTDVQTRWSVCEYMRISLRLQREQKTGTIDYKERIDRIQNKIHIVIDGASHGLIYKDNLLKIDSLYYSDPRYTIVSFVFNIDDRSAISTSNVFTNEMKELIICTNGDKKIYFEEIQVKYLDTPPREVGLVRLKLKCHNY